MKRSLKELKGFTLQAVDGEKGKVKNFLFDDERWVIRYLEADLGGFFSEKRILIPREHLSKPIWEEKHFPVELTVKRIENSPDIAHDLPVSRKYEQELIQHYELKPYWPANIAAYSGRESMFNPDNPFRTPKHIVGEEQVETNLRSFSEVKGYYINALNETFGHIDDLIVDTDDWQITYLVIDTKNILPWGKKALLPIELVDEISFLDKQAKVNLSKETIKGSPDYSSAQKINESYEHEIIEYYRKNNS